MARDTAQSQLRSCGNHHPSGPISSSSHWWFYTSLASWNLPDAQGIPMGISDGITKVILALIGFCRTSLAYFPGGRMCSVEKNKMRFLCLRLQEETMEIRENICSCAKESSALLHPAFFLNLVYFSIDINADQSWNPMFFLMQPLSCK